MRLMIPPPRPRARLLTILPAAMLLAAVLAPTLVAAEPAGKKKIVFLAGSKSHGYGAHEHRAGCLLLARAINESGLDVEAVVHDGWPKEPSALDDADAVVIYCDGAGGHMINPHLNEVAGMMKEGTGLVCIHFAVEVTKGRPGESFLAWLGGYFEVNWSVNPHWTAAFKKLPEHPITRGVKPFAINDEWYYNMRFRPNLKGVTPILTAVPPDSTRKRGDGGRRGNAYVRSRLGEPEHVAWSTERADGGRGFGFTGGHVHWNWGNDQFRKLMLNAIVWAARADVPAQGVPSKPLSVKDLEANQDYPQPKNFDRGRIEKLLASWRG